MALKAAQIKSSSLKRSFLSQFAASPIPTINQFIASQSSDLATILSTSRASQAQIGGDTKWLEEMRRSEVWQGDWVEEGVSVFKARGEEAMRTKALRGMQQEALARQNTMRHPGQYSQMGGNGSQQGHPPAPPQQYQQQPPPQQQYQQPPPQQYQQPPPQQQYQR